MTKKTFFHKKSYKKRTFTPTTKPSQCG